MKRVTGIGGIFFTARVRPSHDDRSIRLRPAEATDADFIYRVVEATMREYVEQIWGSFSEDYNRKNTAIAAGSYSAIEWEAQDIGAMAVERCPSPFSWLRSTSFHRTSGKASGHA